MRTNFRRYNGWLTYRVGSSSESHHSSSPAAAPSTWTAFLPTHVKRSRPAMGRVTTAQDRRARQDHPLPTTRRPIPRPMPRTRRRRRSPVRESDHTGRCRRQVRRQGGSGATGCARGTATTRRRRTHHRHDSVTSWTGTSRASRWRARPAGNRHRKRWTPTGTR